jgi:hypothetical protein
MRYRTDRAAELALISEIYRFECGQIYLSKWEINFLCLVVIFSHILTKSTRIIGSGFRPSIVSFYQNGAASYVCNL